MKSVPARGLAITAGPLFYICLDLVWPKIIRAGSPILPSGTTNNNLYYVTFYFHITYWPGLRGGVDHPFFIANHKLNYKQMKPKLKVALNVICNTTPYELLQIKATLEKNRIVIYSLSKGVKNKTFMHPELSAVAYLLTLGCYITTDEEGYCCMNIF